MRNHASRIPVRSTRAVSLITLALVFAYAVPAGATPAVRTGSPRGVVTHHKGTSTVGFHYYLPQPSLQYYGGPVLRQNDTFVLFWDPAGRLSQTYRDLVVRYFEDVAADSGTTTNVYSVLNQYYDTTGPISYSSTFGGSAVDTNPYPNGCPVLRRSAARVV
jgi:hypothetical protein